MLRVLAFLLLALHAHSLVFFRALTMGISRASFHFDFPGVPYLHGIRHIHSPEHISETHRLGAPFFRLDRVDPPRVSDNKTCISFTCSTLVTKNMRVRMHSSRPDESNLLFLKDGVALYAARFVVRPGRSFASHRLELHVTFFFGSPVFQWLLARAMPVFMFINGLEDRFNYSAAVDDDANLEAYRRGVLAALDSSSFVH